MGASRLRVNGPTEMDNRSERERVLRQYRSLDLIGGVVTRPTVIQRDSKNVNHSSLIRNNVVPCICLRVMTYAWSDATRNAGIRKTNQATRYVGPRVAGCALCYRVVTYYLYAQESFNLGE